MIIIIIICKRCIQEKFQNKQYTDTFNEIIQSLQALSLMYIPYTICYCIAEFTTGFKTKCCGTAIKIPFQNWSPHHSTRDWRCIGYIYYCSTDENIYYKCTDNNCITRTKFWRCDVDDCNETWISKFDDPYDDERSRMTSPRTNHECNICRKIFCAECLNEHCLICYKCGLLFCYKCINKMDKIYKDNKKYFCCKCIKQFIKKVTQSTKLCSTCNDLLILAHDS